MLRRIRTRSGVGREKSSSADNRRLSAYEAEEKVKASADPEAFCFWALAYFTFRKMIARV
jgi:hypothetical protein